MNIIRKIFGKRSVPFSKFIHICWALLFPKWYVKYLYKRIVNKKLSLKDPKDYNEKIQWLKIYSDTSLWTPLADKYKVRDYVTQCGLGDILVKLYGVWESADEIDFSGLPDKFVLKTNHGYGRVLLVEDKNKLDFVETRTQLNNWVNERYGMISFEPHYWNIHRRIIAEEYLEDKYNAEISSSLIDYKFFCFHGEPYIIIAMYDRKNPTLGSAVDTDGPRVKKEAFDIHWNSRTDVYAHRTDNYPPIVPKPSRLDEMLEICRTLSKSFPQVRVDLYEVNKKVYFGEITFTSGGGMQYFTPESFLEMGKKMDLSKVKQRTKRCIV